MKKLTVYRKSQLSGGLFIQFSIKVLCARFSEDNRSVSIVHEQGEQVYLIQQGDLVEISDWKET